MPRPVHFDITAEDPDRAVSFYEQALGWKFNHWGGGGPMDYWLIDTGETQPGIDGGLSRRSEGDAAATTNTIDVASLDSAMEAVKAAGGEIIGDRMAIPGVGWFAAFTDTEGNRFGLMQSDEAAGGARSAGGPACHGEAGRAQRHLDPAVGAGDLLERRRDALGDFVKPGLRALRQLPQVDVDPRHRRVVAGRGDHRDDVDVVRVDRQLREARERGPDR